jgi:hypothetical protein
MDALLAGSSEVHTYGMLVGIGAIAASAAHGKPREEGMNLHFILTRARALGIDAFQQPFARIRALKQRRRRIGEGVNSVRE